MEFTTFPEIGSRAPKRDSLYNRVYTAASSVLNSFLSDEAAASDPARITEPASDTNASSTSASHSIRAAESSTKSDFESSTPGVAWSVSWNGAGRRMSLLPGRSETDAVVSGHDRESTPIENKPELKTTPQLLASQRVNSKSATSPAIVGLSDATAVPTLPSALMPSIDPESDTSTASDVESLFSVASVNTSRDYLAAHYARARPQRPSRISREFWMKDENARTCFGCNRPFTTFRRRHHCRICGQIFCNACTKLVSGERLGQPSVKRVRICTACESALDSNSSSDDEPDSSIASVSVAPPTPGPLLIPHSGLMNTELTGSDGEAEDNDDKMKTWSPMAVRSFVGHSRKVSSSTIVGTPEDGTRDSVISGRSRSSSLIGAGTIDGGGNSSTTNGGGGGVFYSSDVQGTQSYPTSSARFPTAVTAELSSATKKYLNLFLDRILIDSELQKGWHDLLVSKLLEMTPSVQLGAPTDRVAPRDWVKIKLVPESNADAQIEVIPGLVFSATLARKTMPTRLASPRILLVAFPIEYSRGLDRYMSLGPVLAQESEYLRKLVARICFLEPTLVLTSSSICGQAVDMLEKAGVAVATHVRQTALAKLAQYTRANILMSIDRLSARPRLGNCNLFELLTFRWAERAKTYMFFTGRAADPGRAALVRGDMDPENEGHVIKVVLEIMVDVVYSLKMETALMRDQFALVPPVLSENTVPLSSSPFVNYGRPFLDLKVHRLEDDVVRLTKEIDQLDHDEASALQELNLKLPDISEDVKVSAAKYVLGCNHAVAHRRWAEAKVQWDAIQLANPYQFNPSSHQNLLVLFSLICAESGAPCIGPEQMLIEFYLDTDQTLGQAIESIINSADDPCPDGCDRPLGDHHRRYVHGTGMLTIQVNRAPCRLSGLQDSILIWSRCTICEVETPVSPMSAPTWKFSFGKYLELAFWGEPLHVRAGSCPHDIYRDHKRYFGWHDREVSVSFEPIELFEIQGPALHLDWDPVDLVNRKAIEYKSLSSRIRRFWGSVADRLSKVRVEGLEEEMLELSHLRLEQLRKASDSDREECLKQLEKAMADSPPEDSLALNEVLVFVQRLTAKWHQDFADFDGQFFPTEGDIRRVTAQHLRSILAPMASGLEDGESENAEDAEKRDAKSENGEKTLDAKPIEDGCDNAETKREGSSYDNKAEDAEASSTITTGNSGDEMKLQSASGNSVSLAMPRLDESIRPRRHDGKGRVSLLARHFEELSQEFERERQREQQRIADRRRSIAINPSRPVAEVFEDVEEATGEQPVEFAKRGLDADEDDILPARHGLPQMTEEYEDDEAEIGSKAGQTALFGQDGRKEGSDSDIGPNEEANKARSELELLDNKEEEQNMEISEDQKPKMGVSLIRSLANFWAERSSTRWDGIEYVLSPTEHFFANSLVVIRATEPSSIIAFCLGLSDYCERIVSIYRHDSATVATSSSSSQRKESVASLSSLDRPPLLSANQSTTSIPLVSASETPADTPPPSTANVTSNSNVNVPDSAAGSEEPERPREAQKIDVDDARLEHAMLKQTGTHMRYRFSQASTTFSCKIFFSGQFDALRRKCGCSDGYIQSLSRCKSWDAMGGKSGSTFLKTSDSRLIIKELSQVEFDAFSSFAPSYFEYMAQALFHDLPTVLVKFFGLYQITVRNPQAPSSHQMNMYVMVMENLFYGRQFSRFFDLKGSMRNRKARETGRADEVLLDENMVEFIFERPLFVREHSKKTLRASLYNDTLFLTKMNVMDYSLVIGIDDNSKTIVAGIIDFVRTYTWDKKIESWVKGKASTGIKEPTVVSPKQYKVRFRESMEQYFLMVPDCWNQLSIAP